MHTAYERGSLATILVADSDRAHVRAISEVLQREGYEITTAFNAESAVTKAKASSPDLLLIEVDMNPTSGIEIADKITALLPNCRVLFVSANASMADVVKAAPERLIYSFAGKPLRSLNLLDSIAYLLSGLDLAHEEEDTEDLFKFQTVLTRFEYILGKTGLDFEACGSLSQA